MKKIVFISLLVITIILSIYNVSYATSSTGKTTIDGIMSDADKFIKAGQTGEHIGFNKEGIYEASDLIYNTLLIIGIIIIVIIGTILAIKYMTSSVEGQAKIKETLIPFVVGTVVILGAFGIWKLVTQILENLN